jgi:hypothetical protein
MSTQYTTGPWQLSEYTWKDGSGTYRRVEQVEEFGDVVASVCIGHSANHTLDVCADANARLIASAPDLLEALQDLFDADMEHVLMGDGKDDQIEAIAKARAAIAKATGAV